jgi:hypothetical protein
VVTRPEHEPNADYIASLFRTETRGCHTQDYPLRRPDCWPGSFSRRAGEGHGGLQGPIPTEGVPTHLDPTAIVLQPGTGETFEERWCERGIERIDEDCASGWLLCAAFPWMYSAWIARTPVIAMERTVRMLAVCSGLPG